MTNFHEETLFLCYIIYIYPYCVQKFQGYKFEENYLPIISNWIDNFFFDNCDDRFYSIMTRLLCGMNNYCDISKLTWLHGDRIIFIDTKDEANPKKLHTYAIFSCQTDVLYSHQSAICTTCLYTHFLSSFEPEA